MLVLSRKNEQSVIIGESGRLQNIVQVTVLDIGRGNVMLGFKADPSMIIHREEVWREVVTHARDDAPIGDYHQIGSGRGMVRAKLPFGSGDSAARVGKTDC